MDGILNINKPAGKTSFSIVAMVKRLSRERRVGHGGTLDPMATGVLPVCLGQATRVAGFLADAAKVYQAQIELGVTTDTYDATGKVVHQADPSGVDREQVETALAPFRGLISQTPPMYSAIKRHGRPLYQLARAGIQVDRESRVIQVYRLALLDWQPPALTVEVECGKGTYIRSLAHDLGQSLGCGAILTSLTRLRCGPFDIGDAVSMSQLEEAFTNGCWERLVHPMDIVLLHWPAAAVDEETSQAIRNGRPVDLPQGFSTSDVRCRAYSPDGRLLGLLRFNPDSGQWHPEKVFA
ncbi:MAG: tRNA pseudouridine(55) synthase TruB [Chloroflexi bacterium]|nr:tRNA pseudouridine(55) synthase TruB [Chloroflexota bacterium]